MIVASFFSELWPGLVATLIGISAGVPVALALNRSVEAAAARRSNTEASQVLADALESVRTAVDVNKHQLGQLRIFLKAGGAAFDIAFDTSGWDAVKGIISQHLRDPLLQGRLAYHFERMGDVKRVAQLHTDYSVGALSALSNSIGTREAIRQHLLVVGAVCTTDAENLIRQLDARRAILPTPSTEHPTIPERTP